MGMVVTISPNFSLYRMVVFPAASRPTIRIRISLRPHSRSNNFEKVRPMFAVMKVCPRGPEKKSAKVLDKTRSESEMFGDGRNGVVAVVVVVCFWMRY